MVAIVNAYDQDYLWEGSNSVVGVRPIAEVPAGVSIKIYGFAPGSSVRLAGINDHMALCVLSGSGWVDEAGSERQIFNEGQKIFVRPDDVVVIGTDQGMSLLSVFEGWMFPE